jgi:DNA-binding transcriptional LysR family regulator
VLLARWQLAEADHLVHEHQADLALADGFRLGAGLAAERLGLPWVAYTHHYFDETSTSEGMVEYYCQRFGCADNASERFSSWWAELRAELGLASESRGADERCWWNLSPVATLVLGLPELKAHSATAPDYVYRVGPTVWSPPGAPQPAWLSSLGQRRPAVLVALSTNPVPDEALAILGVSAWHERFDLVVTAGAKPLPELPRRWSQRETFPTPSSCPRWPRLSARLGTAPSLAPRAQASACWQCPTWAISRWLRRRWSTLASVPR